MVPVLHIVGYPSTIQQKTRPLLHHTLGDGRYVLRRCFCYRVYSPYFRYDAYQRAATPFVIHEANLLKKETAAAEIDTALTKCITKVSSLPI
jgi:pyruvate decarboxylase